VTVYRVARLAKTVHTPSLCFSLPTSRDAARVATPEPVDAHGCFADPQRQVPEPWLTSPSGSAGLFICASLLWQWERHLTRPAVNTLIQQ